MVFSCFIGIGMFCFDLPEKLNIGPAEVPALRQVAGAGWKFYIDETAKLKKPARPAALSQACEDANCISYWRKCDDAAHPKDCVWYVEIAGELHSLTLIAENEAKAGVAIGAAGVYSAIPSGQPGQKTPDVLPLASLKDEVAP